MKKTAHIFAPATVANVSVGFDILGFAIDHLGDEIIAQKGSQAGVQITGITGDGGKLPLAAAHNTAGYAAMKFLESIGEADYPLSLEIHKKMPLQSGLGSSAASAVAGVMAANEVIGAGKSKDELLRFAVMGEELVDGAWHADNIAPSLYGGFTLIRDNPSLDIIHLPAPTQLVALIIHPHHHIETKESRGVLSDQVALPQHIIQNGNTAAFISSLYTGDLALMKRALQDVIITPQRKHLIPEFAASQDIALAEDAIGFGISGAGPSMFCLCEKEAQAERIQEKIAAHFADQHMACDLFISPINLKGAFVY